MAIDQDRKCRELAARSKYRRLYWRLCGLSGLSRKEWRTTFGEIESVLGFELPPSARLYRPWWANENGNNGHTQARAWTAAGWETAEVDIEAETLVLRKRESPQRKLDIDEIWPVHPTARWPKEGMSLRREDMYEDRV